MNPLKLEFDFYFEKINTDDFMRIREIAKSNNGVIPWKKNNYLKILENCNADIADRIIGGNSMEYDYMDSTYSDFNIEFLLAGNETNMYLYSLEENKEDVFRLKRGGPKV